MFMFPKGRETLLFGGPPPFTGTTTIFQVNTIKLPRTIKTLDQEYKLILWVLNNLNHLYPKKGEINPQLAQPVPLLFLFPYQLGPVVRFP